MNNPLVSIIIPTYNRGKYIKKAIDSCLNQTYSNIEVIVVDDCSPDNTKEIVTSYEDKRVKYFRNDENSGAPYSRNRGIELSNGEFVNFLDDDDKLLAKKIELQLRKFENSDVNKLGVVTCDVSYKRSDIYSVKKNRKKGRIYVDLLKSYCVFGTESMLIKKEAMSNVEFDSQLLSNQEYDLSIQLAKNWNFDYVPEVLTEKYESENQISFNFDKKLKGTKRLWEKYRKEFKKENVYLYNFFRFRYLIFKYWIGKLFGKKVYSKL